MASNWQDIIWREWCHAEDDDIARQLFYLVDSEPDGWAISIIVVLLSIFGLGVIVLISSVLLAVTIILDMIPNPTSSWLVLGNAPILFWIIMAMIIAIGILALDSLAINILFGLPIRGGKSSWYRWLRRITSLKIQLDHRRFFTPKRPAMPELEIALYEACANKSKAQKSWIEALYHLEQRRKNPETVDELIAAMKSGNWTDRFIVRHLFLSVGGEAANKLVDLTQAEDTTIEQHQTALWILQNIGAETSRRLAEQAPDLICSKCLMPCVAHGVRLSALKSFKYYGCAYCHQSHDFLPWPGPIVTVLDSAMAESSTQQGDVLRVNWLRRRTLIDCNWIEIINARDEDVERFAVQVGNDTDNFRKSRYKKMSCVVGPDCHLSENTWRILRSRFGQVEQVNVNESSGRYQRLSANSTPNEITSESETPFASEDVHSS